MEILSRFLHKYVFHGSLWFIHKTHHNQTVHSILQLNDIFNFIFALTSIILINIGWNTSSLAHFILDLGITIYGFIYFVIHDGLIRQQHPFSYKPPNRYLKQVQRAHQHHYMYLLE